MHPRPRHPTLLAALLLAAPLALAHDEAPVGLPKAWCEDADARLTHEYGAPAPLLGPWLLLDGSPGCETPPLDWDQHFEYANGGAYLLAGDAGAQACFGVPADHPSHPTVTVVDATLGSGVRFTVAAAPWYGSGHDCGFFEDPWTTITCVGSCQVPFGPGPDGAYVVFVEGTTGHVHAR